MNAPPFVTALTGDPFSGMAGRLCRTSIGPLPKACDGFGAAIGARHHSFSSSCRRVGGSAAGPAPHPVADGSPGARGEMEPADRDDVPPASGRGRRVRTSSRRRLWSRTPVGQRPGDCGRSRCPSRRSMRSCTSCKWAATCHRTGCGRRDCAATISSGSCARCCGSSEAVPTPRAGRSTGRSSPRQSVDIVGLRDVEAIVRRGSTDQVMQNIG